MSKGYEKLKKGQVHMYFTNWKNKLLSKRKEIEVQM